MANARTKNIIFVDATGDITVDAARPRIWGVLVTPSAANSVVVIKNTSAAGQTIFNLKIEGIESRYVDFSGMEGTEITSTFNITTLTNVTSVMLYGEFMTKAGEVL